jgi:hypothetical protein
MARTSPLDARRKRVVETGVDVEVEDGATRAGVGVIRFPRRINPT